jgi:hypothetical protein
MGLQGEGRWLVVPILVFSACLASRDSPTLNVANSLALVGVACLAARGRRRQFAFGALVSGMLVIFGPRAARRALVALTQAAQVLAAGRRPLQASSQNPARDTPPWAAAAQRRRQGVPSAAVR